MHKDINFKGADIELDFWLISILWQGYPSTFGYPNAPLVTLAPVVTLASVV